MKRDDQTRSCEACGRPIGLSSAKWGTEVEAASCRFGFVAADWVWSEPLNMAPKFRAFSPKASNPTFLGRRPRLGWMRAVGPRNPVGIKPIQ